MCLFFCAYLIRIKKRNNFVEEFFSTQAFFFEKTQFENSTKMVVPFLRLFFLTLSYEKIERVVVEKLNFQFQFSQRKKA
jgi:hypothetical protein